ncbi:colicin-like pore-forming protein [Morganella morganii]|uniref:colicin-like pore-forming protein n=1 Tax=Morganella morganii TaxID=582 RepID=UPI003EC07B68
MANRYEDTTQFERDVMTSMGYHWKGEGWQKATDTGDTMTVTGWKGDIPTEPGQFNHIWNTNIADMNTPVNPVLGEFTGEDNEDMVPAKPVPADVRKQFKDIYAAKLKPLNALKDAITNKLSAIVKDISNTEKKSKEHSNILESENLKLIKKKLQLEKEKLTGVYNEILLEIYQTDFWYTSNEMWFILSDHDFDKFDKVKYGKHEEENKNINKADKDIASQKEKIKQAENEVKKAEDEFSQVKDAVKFTADFYQSVFKAYGEKAEQLAKALADQARGKTIRNIEDALKAYEKHKANINKKINAKDRKAIATALESVKVADIANNFKRFSKGMLHTSSVIDFADWTTELYKATETGNWRPFFVKTEAIVAGRAATVVVAFMFSVLLSNPIGLLGYGLIMAIAGYLINDEMVEKANQFWGI